MSRSRNVVTSASTQSSYSDRGKESLVKPSSSLDPIKPYTVPKGEEIVDIDFGEETNANLCSEYVDDIYKYHRHLEQVHRITPNYMARQPHITISYRECCVDFQVQLHKHMSESSEQSLQLDTLFLASFLLDRFLSRRPITYEKMLTVAISCFYTAAKFEETYYPAVEHLLAAVKSDVKKDDVLVMERLILNDLRYSLGSPTIVSFLKRFAKAAQADSSLGMLARFMAEFSLMSYNVCTNYPPSLIAAASIAHGLRILGRPPWTATLEHYTQYTYNELRPCMEEMREHVRRAPKMKMQAIFQKYSDKKYLSAAQYAVKKI